MLAIADHIEFDEKNLLQCFSQMQDDPKARDLNRVPGPIRQALSTQETFEKIEELSKHVEP